MQIGDKITACLYTGRGDGSGNYRTGTVVGIYPRFYRVEFEITIPRGRWEPAKTYRVHQCYPWIADHEEEFSAHQHEAGKLGVTEKRPAGKWVDLSGIDHSGRYNEPKTKKKGNATNDNHRDS